MQPLAYFAVRSILGWLQFVERSERAFVSNALFLVATGAAHCWAVVYSLFISIHTRAMRFDGYHEGYTEHLPFGVAWTETLAVASMGVWWAAGFTTAAIRIIDEDPKGLPMEGRDVDINVFFQIIRSPRLHSVLATAHALSCVGLFTSIILLCIAMGLMKGGITVCELCLCLVSVGFALPHSVVAWHHLRKHHRKKEEDVSEPATSPEAASQEAAALGPQLCVILALADSPNHAYSWQNAVYLASALSYVAAVGLCGQRPRIVGDAALPPEPIEFFTCLVANVVASLALVMCFPHLNTWHLWALFAFLAVLFLAIWFEEWREIIVDLLDPVLVVRSDADKALPCRRREAARGICRIATLVCAAVAMWDIMLHPVQEGLFEVPTTETNDEFTLPDFWDQNKLLLLRWLPHLSPPPGEHELLGSAAAALGLEPDAVAAELFLPEHRLMLFKTVRPDATSGRQPHLRWRELSLEPKGRLGVFQDTQFPSTLNVTLCIRVHQPEEPEAEPPDEFVEVVGRADGAARAYMAACSWWTRALNSYYGHSEDDPSAHSAASTGVTGVLDEDADLG